MLKVINIKEHYPNSDYAVWLMEQAISDAKSEGIRVLVVVHGYGSHGKGGTIKMCAMQKLKILRKQGVIRAFVPGDNWCDTNEDKLLINSLCPETIISTDIGNLNSGVTVVLVY